MSAAAMGAGKSPGRSGFRPEIEGLRALAIGLVLLFHAGAPVLTGGFVGVDVFFVISGFLITSHIVREIELTGRLDLPSFWGRRMKRLLPAALTVFVVTAVASWLILPMTSWRSVGADIVAAALYVVNWRFATEAVDYNAEGAGVSPVLHFWSLAVEEQFYIVWPLLLALGVWLVSRGRGGERGRRRTRAVTATVLAVVAVPSLAWSIVYTGINPDGAFFVTTTRLWELGAGAAVALGSAYWGRLSPLVASVLGWGGAAAIAISAVVFDEATPWPGAAALVPVLGTAAVIVATTGREASWLSTARLFSLKPLVWMGGLSYSWYLWHWPVLVLAEAQWGELRLRYRLLLVLFAGLLAWSSLRLIENPVRRAKSLSADSGKMLSLGMNLSLLGVIAGLLLVLVAGGSGSSARDGGDAPGANALVVEDDGSILPYSAPESAPGMVPSPVDATSDLPQAEHDGCKTEQDSGELIVCEYGDPDGDLDVAIVGDSKMLQWQPAIARIAEQEGWRLSTYLKSACAFAEPSYDLSDQPRRTCAEWNETVLDRLEQEPPDVVVTSGRQVFDGRDGEDRSAGAERISAWWTQLQEAGIRVVPLLDNPAPHVEVYECAAEHPDRLSECGFPVEDGIARSGAEYQRLAAELSGVERLVDVSDIVCPSDGTCPAVIGDVLVYRQGSHLTDTFVESATELLAQRLVPVVEGDRD